MRGTELCERYERGEWQPYDEETLVDVLVADVLATPPFTRISRMIRDFSAHDIEAGNKKVNLRQLVEACAKGDKLPGRSSSFSFVINSISGERETRGSPLPCSRTCILQVLSCVAALLGFYY